MQNTGAVKNSLISSLTIILSLMLVISPTISPVNAASVNVVFPQYHRDSQTFPANADNHIYVKPNPYDQLVNSVLSFNASSMSQRNYNKFVRSTATTRTANSPFTLGSNGIYEFLNTSNNYQELKYTRNYYELVNNQTHDIKNVFLESGNAYIASLNITELNPIYFEFLFSQMSSASMNLGITVLDPNGIKDTVTSSVTKDMVQIVPFLPTVAGQYLFSLQPSKDGVMDYLNINFNPQVKSIGAGISEHFDQSQTFAKFYKLEGSGLKQVVDLTSIVYQNKYYASDLYPDVTLGSLQVLIFDTDTPLFGFQGTNTLFPSASDEYIVLVAQPADNNLPQVKKLRADQNVEQGMDIDLTLTLRNYPMSSFPFDMDFRADAIDPYSLSTGYRFYDLQTTQTLMLGLNDTVGSDVYIIPDNPELPFYTINSNNNDILNSATDDAIILPAGNYTVYTYSDQTYHFAAFDPTTLNTDTPQTISGTIGNMFTYYLPSTMVSQDYLNFTYLDKNNQSVFFQVDFYDSMGVNIGSQLGSLTYWFDGSDILHSKNYTITNSPNSLNLEGVYARVNVTANEQYINGSLAYFTQTNISSHMQMTRYNSFDSIQANNPTNAYFYDTLNQTLNYNLKSSNSTIWSILDFTAQNDTAYKLTIDSVNRTISLFELYVQDDGNIWITSSMTTLTNISGVSHYILDIYFASSEELHMAMYIFMGNQVLNGTLSISLASVAVTQLPNLSATSMNDVTGPSTSTNNLLTNPLLYVGVIGGIAVIAGIYIIISRRR